MIMSIPEKAIRNQIFVRCMKFTSEIPEMSFPKLLGW